MSKPDRLLIPREDFEYARFDLVGRYGSGNQFLAFVTGAFPADWWTGRWPPEYLRTFWQEHKRWYAVLHRFDAEGNHLGTEVRCGGTTAEGEDKACARAEEELVALLEPLDSLEPCDIRVQTFGVEIDGYFFGLVYELNSSDDPDNPNAAYECVMLQPNDIMFHPPWDSGEYST